MRQERVTEQKKHAHKRAEAEKAEAKRIDADKVKKDIEDILDEVDKILEETEVDAMTYRQLGGE